jgi:hypothetical protein
MDLRLTPPADEAAGRQRHSRKRTLPRVARAEREAAVETSKGSMANVPESPETAICPDGIRGVLSPGCAHLAAYRREIPSIERKRPARASLDRPAFKLSQLRPVNPQVGTESRCHPDAGSQATS